MDRSTVRLSRGIAVGCALSVGLAGAAWGDSNPVTVSDAWTRPTAAGASAAGYLTIVNHARFADSLTGLTDPDAASASVHESRTVGGVTSMRPLLSLAVPAGGSVALKPGGLHVMLRGLKHALKPGDQTTLILTFAKAGRVRVVLRVRTTATPDLMAGMKM